jgi:mRNA interferase RelE/StbE
MKTIILTPAAAKDLDDMTSDARVLIETGLHRYAMTGEGDVKKLSGVNGFRLRLGRYRVLFAEDQTTILAIYIGKRDTMTYKRL